MLWDCCSSPGEAEPAEGWAANQGYEDTSGELGRCYRPALSGPVAHRPLDVHRCRGEPELNLDPASTSDAGAAQAVELFRQAEGAFDAGFSFRQPPFAQWTGHPFLRRLDQFWSPSSV